MVKQLPADRFRVSEKLITQIWQSRWMKRRLFTSDGKWVRVVFSGRANRDCGPDFRGVVIATEQGQLLRGDAELHVRSSDWWAHRHHCDPNYNNVVLHVVMWRKQNC